MKLRTLTTAPIHAGTRVLIRIDADVSTARGSVTTESAFRLDAALPTLKFLLQKKAVITVIGHRGRPAGKKVAALSLAPVQKYLEARLKTKLHFLPNSRFDAREEKNDRTYARELAYGQEIFINESFATAHRAHVSTLGVARILPAYAGLQFEKEVRALSQLLDKPKHPLALIVGGSKIETKLPRLKYFVKNADHIFVVGAGANAFYAARGWNVGGSLVDAASVRGVKKYTKQKNIFIPGDVMLGKKTGGKAATAVALADLSHGAAICDKTEAILDIGPATVVTMSEMLADAHTIIWNGPAGMFERAPFHLGTERIARMLARLGRRGAHVVAGGGETVIPILENKLTRGFSHISTGGGAMLEFLGGAHMPVVDALLQK